MEKNKHSKTMVYIASPYTKGDVAVNVKRSIDCAHQLMSLQYAPFSPLLTHFQHLVHPRPYEDWLHLDLIFMLQCDVVLRLEGESKGADEEVRVAKLQNIPVVYSIEELIKQFPPVQSASPVIPYHSFAIE